MKKWKNGLIEKFKNKDIVIKIMDNLLKEFLSIEEFKNKVWGIGKIKPEENNLQMLRDLLLYSNIFATYTNVDAILEEYKDDFRNSEHMLIIINDGGMAPKDSLELKMKILKKLLELNNKYQTKIWFHIILLSDLSRMSLESKFNVIESLLKFEIIEDKGIFEILKLAITHRDILISFLGKYVVAYVIAGSQVKGRAIESSDVDVYVIIDDTDVREHTHHELKQKLFITVSSTAIEAVNKVKSKKILHPQVYTLTEFWDNLAKNNPVIMSFLRDGIAIHDQGVFVVWKRMLFKGLLHPTKEASDLVLRDSESLIKDSKESVNKAIKESEEKIKNTINKAVIDNLAVGCIGLLQSLIMRSGLNPPDPKETIALSKKMFVEEKKLLDISYINLAEELWNIRKAFERGEIKEISKEKFEELYEKSEKFLKEVKNISGIIDRERLVDSIKYYISLYYDLKSALSRLTNLEDLPDMIKNRFISVEKKINDFNNNNIYFNLELFFRELEDAINLIRQMKDSILSDKLALSRFTVVNDKGNYDIYITSDKIFVINSVNRDKILIYGYDGTLIEEKDIKEFENILLAHVNDLKYYIDTKVFDTLRRIFGEFYIAK